MKNIYLILVTLFLLTGCDDFNLSKSNVKYKIETINDGQPQSIRLNVETGEVSIFKNGRMEFMPDNRTITLEAGKIYHNENGDSLMYKGNNTFTSDTTEIADQLVKKYTDKK